MTQKEILLNNFVSLFPQFWEHCDRYSYQPGFLSLRQTDGVWLYFRYRSKDNWSLTRGSRYME